MAVRRGRRGREGEVEAREGAVGGAGFGVAAGGSCCRRLGCSCSCSRFCPTRCIVKGEKAPTPSFTLFFRGEG